MLDYSLAWLLALPLLTSSSLISFIEVASHHEAVGTRAVNIPRTHSED